MWLPVLLLIVDLLGQQAMIAGVVSDPGGAPIPAARVTSGGAVATTDAAGRFELPLTPPVWLRVSAPGFSDAERHVTSSGTVHIVLQPRGVSETVTVSASDAPLRVGSPAAVTIFDAETLAAAPALTLDEQLRGVPGFSLFRRSSSRVANPTTQGVTLRGLAASGASRAVVTADGATLNDPFGGWVYWDRIPAAAIERVEVARGGASDAFGTDALGGAIRLETARTGLRAVVDGGSDATGRASAFAGSRSGRVGLRGGAEWFTTDGFIVVAPESRGPIDTPASSRHTSAYAGVGFVPALVRVDVRAGYFSEDRENGTPFQTNATTSRDLAASASGEGAGGLWSAQGAFNSQDYDQAFSSVSADRATELPTSRQHVDVTSAAFSADWVRPVERWTVLLSVSGKQVKAAFTDQRLPPPSKTAALPIPAIQRTGAVVSQLSWTATPSVTLAAGLRGEIWTTEVEGGVGKQTLGGIAPRASIAFRATQSTNVRLSFQDAYRLPTVNELYRPFRVGNVLTQANPGLLPEESYGLEGAVLVTRGWARWRGIGFIASVHDPIVNVTIDESPNLILRRRDNAGRIRAAGLESELEVRAGRTVAATASVAWIDSRFVAGPLDDLRVPQVPRIGISAGVIATWPRATVALQVRHTGSQFDDDRNAFLLDPATTVDGRVAYRPNRSTELFAAVENVLDSEQDVGRTPVRTIGLPRTLRVGLRIRN